MAPPCSAAYPEPLGLCDLPEDLFDLLGLTIGRAADGPACLALLGTASRRTWALASSPALVAQLCAERGAPPAVSSLRHLDVHEALCQAAGGCVQFQAAGLAMVEGSQARLQVLARPLRRHADLTLKVEAHTGATAASATGAAADHHRQREEMQASCSRAAVVANSLAALGVDGRQVKTTGWGTALSGAAGWLHASDAARAELFFALDGVELPPRPGYYDQAQPGPQVVCQVRSPAAWAKAPAVAGTPTKHHKACDEAPLDSDAESSWALWESAAAGTAAAASAAWAAVSCAGYFLCGGTSLSASRNVRDEWRGK